MKRASVVVALAAIAVAIWYLRRPSSKKMAADAPPPPARVIAAPAPGGESPSTPAAGPTRTVDHVTKLATAEERKRLADRIAAAQTARATTGRAATRAPAPPSLPEAPESEDAPISKTAIRDAMREVIPHLTECYDAAIPDLPGNELQLVAELTLTGDPDIGTIIDAKELADKQGNKLPAKFDDCLRTTFQSLALPPLAEGDTVSVHYPFVFSH